MQNEARQLTPEFFELIKTVSDEKLKKMVILHTALDRLHDEQMKKILDDMQFNLLHIKAIVEEMAKRKKQTTTTKE